MCKKCAENVQKMCKKCAENVQIMCRKCEKYVHTLVRISIRFFCTFFAHFELFQKHTPVTWRDLYKS